MGFNNHDKQILAKRAGYHCSICDKLTVGPSSDNELTITTTGDAAHIVGEKPTSKRHDKSWTPEQLNNIDNGIWLCAIHHRMIDRDETEHTATKLKALKEAHLKRVSLSQTGINANNGIIISLKIENIGPINKSEYDFGNITLIKGTNGSGKSLICEIIASLSNTKYLDRWKSRQINKGNSEFEISFFQTREVILRTQIDRLGNFTSYIDAIEVPQHISPIHCLFLQKDFKHPKSRKSDVFINHFAMYFGMESNQFIHLIKLVGKNKRIFCNDIFFNEKNELMIKMNAGSHDFKYRQLSSGEQQRIILEIAMRLAHFYSYYRPTLLIIERNAVDIIDDRGISVLLNELYNLSPNFQFIFTAHSLPKDLNLDNFQFINLDI